MSRYDEEKKRLNDYDCVIEPTGDDPKGVGAVLLSNEIEHFAIKYKMIDPFNRDNLKPAAYELTVGDEFSIGGKIGELKDNLHNNKITIPSFQVVVIKTGETINLPLFIIARWNIKVSKAYEGLLWVGGPQVDPGYVGHLYCPIYNLSDKDVIIKMNEPIAVIDFVKTTPFIAHLSKPYNRPPKRILFEEYKPELLKSALFSQAKERVDEMEKRLVKMENKINTSQMVIFTVIAIIIAALSVMVSHKSNTETPPRWMLIGVVTSFIAISIALIALFKSKTPKKPIYPIIVEEKMKSIDFKINGLYIIIIIGIVYVVIKNHFNYITSFIKNLLGL